LATLGAAATFLRVDLALLTLALGFLSTTFLTATAFIGATGFLGTEFFF